MRQLATLSLLLAAADAAYELVQDYSGKAFFEGLNFITYDDPTHGYVNYVDEDTAWNKGYISVRPDEKIYIGVDFKTVASGRGRDSIRLESKRNYTTGLFILDLDHMPHGCGTWPAWWTCGPDWPDHGEIDVLEGVHEDSSNLQTLHTSPNCSMAPTTSDMTGSWENTNCDVYATDNAGCSILGAQGSYGETLNAQTGGIYAMEWTRYFIRVYFFPRGQIPPDLSPSALPIPEGWGKPVGYWPLGGDCSPNHFSEHAIVFDNTFCGDWAGHTFAQACPTQAATQTCEDYVRDNPAAFADAFWLINDMRVYQQK